MNNLQTQRWINRGMISSGVAVITAIAALSPPTATAGQNGKGIAWKASMHQAQQEAQRTGKPILVKFHATWCGACKQLASQTLTKPAVVAESKKWVALQVDIDKSPKLAQQYGVEALPTVAFLRPDGTLATSFVGFHNAGEAVKIMQAAYAKAKAPTKTAAASSPRSSARVAAQPVAAQPSCWRFLAK